MTPDEFSQIANALTVQDGEYLDGLVNVNTAPAAVLACLPGIGQEFAEKLVAFRRDKPTDELKTVAWVTNVLDREHAVLAGPYITTRSYQFSADIAAVGPHGRGFRRDLLVFDVSSGKAVVAFRRDLTRLGWCLGAQIREEYNAPAVTAQ